MNYIGLCTYKILGDIFNYYMKKQFVDNIEYDKLSSFYIIQQLE